MLMYLDPLSFSAKFLSGISRCTYIIIPRGHIFNNIEADDIFNKAEGDGINKLANLKISFGMLQREESD